MSPRHPTRRSRVLRPLVRWAALAAVAMAVPLPAARAADGELATSKPAVVPAAAAAAPAASTIKVLVLPFAALGDGSVPAAMGNAMAETLSADLSAPGGAESVKGTAPAADAAAASAQARDRGAKYAVFGTTQSFGGEVRVTGQVVDAQSGGTVGTLRASGPAGQFFAVQDAIVRQVGQAIGGPAGGRMAASVGEYVRPAPAAPRAGSYWAEYIDLYEPVSGSGAGPNYAAIAPPTPPAPPMYGNGNSGYFGGGYYDGGFAGIGVPVQLPYPIQLGTVRTQYFGQLGTSIIPPSNYPAATPIKPPSAQNGVGPHYQGLHGLNTGEPITKYVNPWARFASPVGLPQRAAPPNLRPGASSPAASPLSASKGTAAKGR